MDISKNRVQSMIGYKFFKEFEDHVEIVRLVYAKKYSYGNPSEVTIMDSEGNRSKIRVDKLAQEYTPLEPDAILSVSIVNMFSDGNKEDQGVKDVIVSTIKMLDVKLGSAKPFAVCRQNITDIFNNLVVATEDDMLYGVAVNQADCPTNFDFMMMLACDSVVCSDFINYYREDTLEDLLPMCTNIPKYNQVLDANRKEFIKSYKGKLDPGALFKPSFKGWCKDLEFLLKENNFQNDINEMLGITEVDFDISGVIEKKKLDNGTEYDSLRDDVMMWMSTVYDVVIKETTVLEYNHDINLGDLNNTHYIFIRDKSKKLYIIVYMINDEEKESDLLKEYNKMDFSDRYRLAFYNKYSIYGLDAAKDKQ